MPTQTEVDNYIADLRQKKSQAVSTFPSATTAELNVFNNDTVVIELHFEPAGSTQADKAAAEADAIAAADELRGFGGEANLNGQDGYIRVYGVFKL